MLRPFNKANSFKPLTSGGVLPVGSTFFFPGEDLRHCPPTFFCSDGTNL